MNDIALSKGQWASRNREKASQDSVGKRGQIPRGHPTWEEIEKELGGTDGWYTMFSLLYCGMFADPRMSYFFDSRDKDVAVSAMEHGKRVGASLLDDVFGTKNFESLGRGSSKVTVGIAHVRAKECPMRPKA